MRSNANPFVEEDAVAQDGERRVWPTIWGLQPTDVHERFWAARGIQVVRLGSSLASVGGAELYLLVDSGSLVIFRVVPLLDQLNWVRPRIVYIRLDRAREEGYREEVRTDAEQRFLHFQRIYYQGDSRKVRVALTPDAKLARIWQGLQSPREGWFRLREEIKPRDRSIVSVRGQVFDGSVDREVMQFIFDIITRWHRPDSTVLNVKEVSRGVWAHGTARVEAGAKFIGPAWIGAARHLTKEAVVVGPAALWDDPGSRPATARVDWQEIEPKTSVVKRSVEKKPMGRTGKRAFDIVFSLFALACTLPFFPLVMLFIWLEDGRPFFFAHLRESLGGREFWCLKFRSMRRDAEKVKAELMDKNQVDGPQFFIENDPRLTRVGSFMRKTKIDELPQFFNVLKGQMSVVGPRPSPFAENQFCPVWREARLSVRPGITGLWQVRRTRRRGCDFQEWIKYDIEYVEKANWRLDSWILWKTIGTIFRGR